MNKFFGKIGYAETIETEPGVWEDQISEHNSYGDWIRNSSKFQLSDEVNDNVNISNEISIVSDPYSTTHYFKIRYVEFMGTKWKVTSVEIKYPRIVLTVGGVYNGQ